VSHHETQGPRRAYWLLAALLFLLIHVPFLASVPLSPAEAEAAAVAKGLWGGQGVAGARLHPLATAMLAPLTGGVNEWSVRLPGVLATLLAGVCTARVTRREEGRLAGMVAGAAILTALWLAARTRISAGDALAACLVALGWLAFYWLGHVHRRWNAMWIVALLPVLLASLETGLRTFAVFYFPLCFLRRPLRIWQRMLNPVHITALVAALVIHRFWLYGGVVAVFTTRAAGPAAATGSYVGGLVTYPFRCLVLALPWALFAWPGFCAAFRPAEKRPVFTSFLRTLLVTLFLVGWILPAVRPLVLLPLVCPLAALTGANYDLLVRRYGRELNRILALTTLAVAVVAGLALLGAVAHATGLFELAGLSRNAWGLATAAFLGALLPLGVGCLRAAARTPWLRLACIATAAALIGSALYGTLAPVYRFPQRSNGHTLAAAVPPNATVYDLTGMAQAAERFYLGRPVIRLATADDLPADPDTIYLLGLARPPVLETRTWTECSPAVCVGQRPEPVLEWRPRAGILARLGLVWEQDPGARDRIVRMYRGVRRPAPGTPDATPPANPPPPARE